YKARKDNLRRVCSAFPEAGDALKVMFQRGSRIYGSLYLSLDMRMGLMREVEKSALREGVTFSTCREGLAPPVGINCDGTHLILCKNRA
ncbi:MAG TPA: radical SAM protein, partial [Methanothrix sp.]|nr:radical SAM protein [Methanothrix sp.]